MDFRTEGMVNAVQAGLERLTPLVIGYALSIVGAIVILIVGYVVAGLLERWIYRALGRIRGSDETLRRFLSKTARYAILVLVIVSVLAQFGVQTASIIAALGAVGLAIGLALQGTLQNVAAGIMLLILKPFRVGEYIDTGSIAGTIVEIGLFATEMTRYDGVYIMTPNSELWNSSVTNYSRNKQRRNDITIRIAYDADIGTAQATLKALADADKRVLRNPEPVTYVVELADSSINLTLRYWAPTDVWWDVHFDLTKAAKIALDEKGISIPFTHREMKVLSTDTGDPGASAPPLPAGKRKRPPAET